MEEKLELALMACATPDTATVRKGEEALQKILRGKNSILLLIKLVHGSNNVSVRHLSGVLLRVKLGMHWIRLTTQEQEYCKQTLLESLLKEQSRPVRLCICYAISSLARHQFTAGPSGWPSLLALITQTTQDANSSDNREHGFLLMYTLTETLGTHLRSSLPELVQTFIKALTTETDARVYSTVLKASSSLIEFLSEEEEVMLFQPVIAFLMDALQRGAFANDEFGINTAVQVVELVSNLSESPLPVLDPYITPSCVVLGALASNTNVNESIRGAAASAICDVLESKARLVSKSPDAYKAVLQSCLNLCRETAQQSSQQHPEDELLEDDDFSLKDITEAMVSAYSNSLPTKLVVETLLSSAAGMIQNEANQIDREAGLIVLIVASEGIAAELVESHADSFDRLVYMVMDCISRDNQSLGTTKHALMLLTQWTEYLWPLMESHAARIIPSCLLLARSYHDVIFPAASQVLQQYCASMEEEDIAPYIDDINVTALDLFAPERRKTPATVRAAIETLSYGSIAAGAKFAPYFDRCIHIVSPLMTLAGAEYSEVRAHATALLGQLAVVSKTCTPPGAVNPFLMFVPELLQKCIEGLHTEEIGDLDYRDSSHHLFANIGNALGVGIERFLPEIVSILINDCTSDDNDVVKKVVDRDGGIAQIPETLKKLASNERRMADDNGEDDYVNQGESSDDDEAETGAEGNLKELTTVREAAADSKASAFSALDALLDIYALSDASSDDLSKCTLIGRLHDIINVCCDTIDNYLHPQVRANALGALGSALFFAFRAECPTGVSLPKPEELRELAFRTFKDSDFELRWYPGRSFTHVVPSTRAIASETIVPYIVEAMTTDNSKIVAAKGCEVIERVSQQMGCTVFDEHAKVIIESLVILLQGEAQCQRGDEMLRTSNNAGADEEDADDDDDDENRRHDEVLLDTLVEALANLAMALGQERFSPLVGIALPVLIRRSKPKMPLRDRVSAVGCINQLLTVAPRVEAKLANKVAQLAVEAMKQNQDMCLRRNGIVLCGTMVEKGYKELNPMALIALLKPIFAEHSGASKHRKWEIEDDLALLDNGCSLIARILRYVQLPDDLIGKVLTEFLAFLPLKFDHEEDWVVYDTLCSIAEKLTDSKMLGEMLRVCSQAIDDVTGKGSSFTIVRLSEIIIAKLGGAAGVPPDFVNKVLAKKQTIVL